MKIVLLDSFIPFDSFGNMAGVEKVDPFEISGSGVSFPVSLEKAMLDLWADPSSALAADNARKALADAGLAESHFLIFKQMANYRRSHLLVLDANSQPFLYGVRIPLGSHDRKYK